VTRPNKREAAILKRHFLHSFKTGHVITREVHTNATQVTHHELCGLERKKLVTFEEHETFASVFGVRGWKVVLTEAGRREVVRVANGSFWHSSWDFFHTQGRAAALIRRAACLQTFISGSHHGGAAQ
jgi:hypothetical protein